ncbi:Origin recognition complex subunit 2 [Sporothrix eucalyptigena]
MARASTKRDSNRDGAAAAVSAPLSQQERQSPNAQRFSPPENRPAGKILSTPTKAALTPSRPQNSQFRGRNGVTKPSAIPPENPAVYENQFLLATQEKPKPRHVPRRRAPTRVNMMVEEDEEDDEVDEDFEADLAMQIEVDGDDWFDAEKTDEEVEEEDDGPVGDNEGGQGEGQTAEPAAAAEEQAVSDQQPAAVHPAPAPVETPKKRGRGRPPKARFVDRFDEPGTPVNGTPSKKRRTDPFATPTKATPSKASRGLAAATPNTRRILADRSARKKSTRALIDRMVAGSDDEDEEALNDAILDAEFDEEEEEEIQQTTKTETNGLELGRDIPPAEEAAPTPRKRGRPRKDQSGAPTPAKAKAKAPPQPLPDGTMPVKRGRGRPRKTDLTAPSNSGASAAATRMPTPPRDLPAHEHYFYQNRAGAGIKTSNNTLSTLRLLTYDEYFRLRDGGSDCSSKGNRHEKEIGYLEALHAQSFPQWAFELAQGFSVCLYGYGSKQRVLRAFATALHKGIRDHAAHKIVMVNTSTAGVAVPAGASGSAVNASASAAASTLRDILLVVAAAATTMSAKSSKDATAPKLPSGAAHAERIVLGLLDKLASHSTVTLIINGIDSPSLRRPAAQATLARLAAHPSVRLLCAADTPGFALLWDGAARSQQNFVFHDSTTFRPLAGLDTVDEVHALLGRRVRRVGGKDGAAFVLRSLPENARTLFQLLIGEVLAADDGGGNGRNGGYGGDDDDDDDADDRDGAGESVALEYRMLYNKAVEEFICSSEMAFRTLLKEFHDHQMVTSRKDAFGTEMLSLPFRRDELEGLLEDLAS